MSKTSQRKRDWFNEGARDFDNGYPMLTPFFKKNHPFNIAYKAGYQQAIRNKQLSINNSLLQWFRVKFNRESL